MMPNKYRSNCRNGKWENDGGFSSVPPSKKLPERFLFRQSSFHRRQVLLFRKPKVAEVIHNIRGGSKRQRWLPADIHDDDAVMPIYHLR